MAQVRIPPVLRPEAGGQRHVEAAARREGFRELYLVATKPGLPLYLSYGFEPLEELEVTMPDGIAIECVSMEKPIV